MLPMRRLDLLLIPGVLLLFASAWVVVYFSWLPSPAMSESRLLPAWFANWLDNKGMEDARTALPCVPLGLGAMLVIRRLSTIRSRLLLAGSVLLLPVAVELGQLFIPARFCSLSDMAWGWAGIIAGGIVAWLAIRILGTKPV